VRLPVLSASDVSAAQLCCGCGVCAYMRPDLYGMGDVEEFGRRPIPVSVNAKGDRLQVCPGVSLSHSFDAADPELLRDLLPGCGPVYGVWEGHASDPEVRFSGSSGGVLSALCVYALEVERAHGVLHSACKPSAPYLNETVLSTSGDHIRARTGSRYSPASPCERLDLIESAPAPCVFVGKPCDVAAVQAAREHRPALDEKLMLTIAFFCAGTPSTKGTLALLAGQGINDPAAITSLRYRGNGWPGRWTVRYRAGNQECERSLDYETSWGFLQKYRQWRCYICPDHTGEFADVAVGDAWSGTPPLNGEGTSLVLARTPRGREFLKRAAESGYVSLRQSDLKRLPESQPNLLRARGALFGRLLALRVLRAPHPRYKGFPTLRFWLTELGLIERIRSIVGTARRVNRRGLKRAQAMSVATSASTDVATESRVECAGACG
jgi:coenzyme F420 hydrogenase subunit beta